MQEARPRLCARFLKRSLWSPTPWKWKRGRKAFKSALFLWGLALGRRKRDGRLSFPRFRLPKQRTTTAEYEHQRHQRTVSKAFGGPADVFGEPFDRVALARGARLEGRHDRRSDTHQGKRFASVPQTPRNSGSAVSSHRVSRPSLTPQAACGNASCTMSEEEIKRYLASIGSKGGKSGKGKSKLRGTTAYYKRISMLAAKARKAKAAMQGTASKQRRTK